MHRKHQQKLQFGMGGGLPSLKLFSFVSCLMPKSRRDEDQSKHHNMASEQTAEDFSILLFPQHTGACATHRTLLLTWKC